MSFVITTGNSPCGNVHMHCVCRGQDSLEQQLFISDVSGGHKHQGPHGTLRVVQQSWMLVVPVCGIITKH